MNETLLDKFKKNINTIVSYSSLGINVENETEIREEREPSFYDEGNKKIISTKVYDMKEEFYGILGFEKEKTIGMLIHETGIMDSKTHEKGEYEFLDIMIMKSIPLDEGEIKPTTLIRIEKTYDGIETKITRTDYKKSFIPLLYKKIEPIKEIQTEWFS